MTQNTLIIMLKQPRAGRVKTRLGRDIGMTAAAWWFRHQTRQLLRNLRDPRWRILLAVSPDRTTSARDWPRDLLRVPQGPGDLGQRMKAAFWQTPPGPSVLIGGDIPGVTPIHIARAFQLLGHHDAVFGPAQDGGFWLVGLKSAPTPHLFQNVRWSSPHTLGDTLATLPGKRIAFVDMLQDVDTARDLAKVK